MSSKVTGLQVRDVRFPTSRGLHGSDAMNPDPDYSAAYVSLCLDDGSTEGDGFVFTIGRGTEIVVAAIEALEDSVRGLVVDDVLTDLGSFSRRLLHDSALRWLGPEKGVTHMAMGAVLNAFWDLRAKRAGLPLWKLLATLTPPEVVDLVDFRYLTDALTPTEATDLLWSAQEGREAREAILLREGYPAYTTTPGWLGYDDATLVALCKQAVADGFTQIKIKVGRDVEEDVRRLALVRATVGPDLRVAVDANQSWDVDSAVSWIERLAPYDPWWVEEPTSPDDILGLQTISRRIAPVPVATGEHVHNRVMFKQLLQTGALSYVQLDATRVAGVNENLAILLLAAKFGVPVCPHAGGVGLCELVQHLSMYDYLCVSGSLHHRAIEYVDHLHEHFVAPVELVDGRYRTPLAPGTGATLRATSLGTFAFPHGPAWAP
jgi:L-fuconate dehydratase